MTNCPGYKLRIVFYWILAPRKVISHFLQQFYNNLNLWSSSLVLRYTIILGRALQPWPRQLVSQSSTIKKFRTLVLREDIANNRSSLDSILSNQGIVYHCGIILITNFHHLTINPVFDRHELVRIINIKVFNCFV